MPGPLTWRDVAAPNFSGTLDGYRVASGAMNNAFSGLSDALSKYTQTNQDQAAAQLLLNGMQNQDAGSYKAAQKNGSILNGVDLSFLTPGAVSASNSQVTNLLNQATLQQTLDYHKGMDPAEIQAKNDYNKRYESDTPTEVDQGKANLITTQQNNLDRAASSNLTMDERAAKDAGVAAAQEAARGAQNPQQQHDNIDANNKLTAKQRQYAHEEVNLHPLQGGENATSGPGAPFVPPAPTVYTPVGSTYGNGASPIAPGVSPGAPIAPRNDAAKLLSGAVSDSAPTPAVKTEDVPPPVAATPAGVTPVGASPDPGASTAGVSDRISSAVQSPLALSNLPAPFVTMIPDKPAKDFVSTTIDKTGDLSDKTNSEKADILAGAMDKNAATLSPDIVSAMKGKYKVSDGGVNRAYIGELLDRYNGNVNLALAAYKAGPARVDQWSAFEPDTLKGRAIPIINDAANNVYNARLALGQTGSDNTDVYARTQTDSNKTPNGIFNELSEGSPNPADPKAKSNGPFVGFDTTAIQDGIDEVRARAAQQGVTLTNATVGQLINDFGRKDTRLNTAKNIFFSDQGIKRPGISFTSGLDDAIKKIGDSGGTVKGAQLNMAVKGLSDAVEQQQKDYSSKLATVLKLTDEAGKPGRAGDAARFQLRPAMMEMKKSEAALALANASLKSAPQPHFADKDAQNREKLKSEMLRQAATGMNVPSDIQKALAAQKIRQAAESSAKTTPVIAP